eukprot:TRINITY_DN82050_c0_g1_i1.p1 TRINITY_DN82050_c0_g1~~TRINITY_DN82050_c0_g1_i1.p1  ORF type:complete len:288 (-),score=45.79 TRINITY_DN82050_c0_g1_i1:201-1064(-)
MSAHAHAQSSSPHTSSTAKRLSTGSRASTQLSSHLQSTPPGGVRGSVTAGTTQQPSSTRARVDANRITVKGSPPAAKHSAQRPSRNSLGTHEVPIHHHEEAPGSPLPSPHGQGVDLDAVLHIVRQEMEEKFQAMWASVLRQQEERIQALETRLGDVHTRVSEVRKAVNSIPPPPPPPVIPQYEGVLTAMNGRLQDLETVVLNLQRSSVPPQCNTEPDKYSDEMQIIQTKRANLEAKAAALGDRLYGYKSYGAGGNGGLDAAQAKMQQLQAQAAALGGQAAYPGARRG